MVYLSTNDANFMYIEVGVKVLLQNPEGKYLFLKRSMEKYDEARKDPWDIVGGRIDPALTLVDALQKEVHEETQLEIIDRPKLVGAQDIMGIAKYPDRHVVRLTYIAKTQGEPVLSEEHSEYAWFSVEEIKDLGDSLGRFLRELLENGVYEML